jgi:hypothetical protein
VFLHVLHVWIPNLTMSQIKLRKLSVWQCRDF